MEEYDNPRILDKWIKSIGSDIDSRLTVIDMSGKVLADSHYNPVKMDNHLNRPEIIELINGKNSSYRIRRSKTLQQQMFYYSLPIKVNGNLTGFLRLSKSLNAINETIEKNTQNYLLFFFLTVILSFILAWGFSNGLVRPLNKLGSMAEKLAHGNFKERIVLNSYNNELGTLAHSFNYMANELERKIEEIFREKSRTEAVFTSIVDGLIVTDNEKKITMVNPAARKILGLNKGVLGRDIIEVIRHHKVDQLLETSLEKKKILKEELNFQTPGSKIIRLNFAPIENKEGQVAGGLIVLTDVTELRRLEQLRKEFVANVSHELKTPLTSIIGYIDTIIDNDIKDDTTIKRFLSIIKDEADRLYLLIKDLLDLSKLEAKRGEVILQPGDLNKIVKKIYLMLQEQAESKDIDLKLDIKEKLPFVYLIPEQIEQVLINLVDNGIKYTEPGGRVILRAYEENNRVVVEVEDNGIGIPEEDQGRIFERFYRVDKARSRSMGGTGIGLSIVKHIIKNHDSEIKVESEPGKGSLFRFYLNKVN